MDLPGDWKAELETKIPTNLLKEMETFLDQQTAPVYPSTDDIFSAFYLTPLAQVKVVIVGQDPYHGMNQAHGLAFSVKNNIKLPPSLKNIFKELARDTKQSIRTNGCLEDWAKQGVFLYNTCLSVEEGSPLSHQNKGWELLSRGVFEVLSELPGPVVFMFWGKAALHYATIIEKKHNKAFLILKANHPSPLSFKGFFGCSHFTKANEFLEFWGKTPISWN